MKKKKKIEYILPHQSDIVDYYNVFAFSLMYLYIACSVFVQYFNNVLYLTFGLTQPLRSANNSIYRNNINDLFAKLSWSSVQSVCIPNTISQHLIYISLKRVPVRCSHSFLRYWRSSSIKTFINHFHVYGWRGLRL